MFHPHCGSCVLAQCKSTADNCPVEPCPNGCQALLHRCKTENHTLYICPASSVPCTNACYGCEAVLPRAKLGHHLKHCPASVVQCRFAYDRPAIESPTGTEEPTTAGSEAGELLPDQKSLLADISLAAQDTKRVDYRESSRPIHFDIEGYPGRYMTHASDKSRARRESIHPRIRVCIVDTVTNYDYYSNSRPASTYFSFPCNEIVRRDEFSAHWKDCHVTVQTDMYSIIERCPLRSYGCAHKRVCMTPDPSGASLEYLQEADCFALKLPDHTTSESQSETVHGTYAQNIQKKQELAFYGYEEEGSYDVLSQLPVEILMKICSDLDSLSLWNLSMVNYHIRIVCFNLVKKRGIVYCTWHRNKDTKKWEQGKKVRG